MGSLRDEERKLLQDAERWRALLRLKHMHFGFIGADPSRECIKIEVPLRGEPIWNSDDGITLDFNASLTSAIDALREEEWRASQPDEYPDGTTRKRQ